MAMHDPLGLVGRIVDGKYDLLEVAGTGGTAVVYRATDLTWQRRVAVKVVRSLGETSQGNRDLLMNQLVTEARILASLSERTSAIVQARDFGTIATASDVWAPYLVLEWLEGQTLDAMLEDERARGAAPRGVVAAIELLDPVARALALAHRSGIAHRDVKPGNLFVVAAGPDDEPTTKVLDFGIAKVVSDVHALERGFRRTASAFTAFTPAYGAPEQFSRAYGATGPWTDVFGLALVLAETATGMIPLGDGDLPELAARACSEDTRPTLSVPGVEVSAEVAAVFARAVAVHTSNRYATVEEFWTDLRAAAGLEVGRRSSTMRMATARLHGPVVLRAASDKSADASSSLRPVSTTGRHRTTIRADKRPALALAAVTAAVLAVGTLVYSRTLASAPPVGPVAAVVPVSSASAPPSAAPAPAPPCDADMALIPGGSFFMGSDEKEALDFEKPAHKVTLHAFCIDRTEVTVAAYRRCSQAGACREAPTTNDWDGITAAERTTYDPLCNASDPVARANHPVNCVDWTLADAYCRAQGRRLPSEAEWELAARGQDGRTYPWGDEPPSPSLLNACGSECTRWGAKHRTALDAMYEGDDGFAATAPVGSFPKGASRYGVLDIVGNVWEWVGDRYGEYSGADAVDPHGPDVGDERVIRGGAWNGAHPAWVRPTFRYKDAESKRSHGIGFRCASTAR